MAEPFKVGDAVQLKSGGPRMTIQSIGDHNGLAQASCIWFDGTKQQKDAFELTLLTPAPPSVMTAPVRQFVRVRGF